MRLARLALIPAAALLVMEPGTMTVAAGVPVTFVVTNSGTTDHEF